jgi:two-component sensor histidine kinase
MRSILFLIVTLFTFSFQNVIIAQDLSEKKQLLKTIDTTQNVEDKVQLYADLAWEFIITENDSALIYTEKALVFSKEKNYPLGQAIALESNGLYHEIVNGDLETASKLYFDAVAICQAYKLTYEASIFHTIGVMFHQSDNYTKALEYYDKAYLSALKTNDLAFQKKCLINMGSINSSLEKYDKAEELMLKSIDLKVRPDLDYSTYANLSRMYTTRTIFDKAVYFAEKATQIHPDNPESEQNLYFLIYAKTQAQDTTGMSLILKRAKKALENTVGLRDKSLFLRNIADYHKFTGDYKQALQYRDAYVSVFESLKEKQRDQTVYDLETKYQTQEKEREIEKQTAAKKLLYWILGSILVLLGIVFMFYRDIKKKSTLLAKQKLLLEKTVSEKNVLLKETHHRVKNSFQIVSSLLFLQSKSVKDKEAKLAIKEAQNRVRSMVLIHQKLYNKDALVGIETKDYFEDLVRDIFDSHQDKSQGLKYNLNAETMVLSIETITPLGLILNELIVNVLKHAYPKTSKNGLMQIIFEKAGNELLLTVKDNGVGFSGPIDASSFGIKLITALSKKLKATLNFKSEVNKGTEAVLNITKFELL